MSTTLELRVYMDCPGCESKIKKALQKLDGVDDVDIDMETQKVTVTGYIEQEEALKIVRRNGRSAELWPFPDNPQFEDIAPYYYHNPHQNHIHPTAIFQFVSEPPSPNNNNNYNDEDYGYYSSYNQQVYYRQPPHLAIMDNQEASVMFNDDNTGACVIM